MGRKKRYSVAGKTFESQSELAAAVKKALNSHPLDTEFADGFLAAVVNELHDEVIAAGQEVARFIHLSYKEQVRRRMPTAGRFRGGTLLMGYFEPLGQWRDVTVYPWRKTDNRTEIKRAFRGKIAPHLPKPSDNDKCNVSGCSARGSRLEYEHISPTFDEIAERCLSLVTPTEIENKFGYSKFAPETYTLDDFIPDDHPAVKLLIELHRGNEWTWLCPYHHRNVKEKR